MGIGNWVDRRENRRLGAAVSIACPVGRGGFTQQSGERGWRDHSGPLTGYLGLGSVSCRKNGGHDCEPRTVSKRFSAFFHTPFV
jgi:hypothetical protein